MMKRIGIIGAALFVAGALWAAGEPTISLDRVQQRYPWNGKVDIDFSIKGDCTPNEYYVRLTLVKSSGGSPVTLREFEDDAKLYAPVAGDNQRVTWDSAWEDQECRFFDKNATFQAELVYCGAGDKSDAPYGARYVIVNLKDGSVTNRVFHDPDAAWTFFDTDEYKLTNMVFRRIHCGSFVMGSPVDATDADTNRTVVTYNESGVATGSTPLYRLGETQHKVTLTENFLIGIFPLTVRQYELISNTDRDFPKTEAMRAINWNTLRGEDTAVESAPSAASWLGKLNARVNKPALTFDLPTEAQWEYACRAGTTGAVYTNLAYESIAQTDRSVGGKVPNAWGLFNMYGGVEELCRDRVRQFHDWSSIAVVDPVVAETDDGFVWCVGRGGGYWSNAPDVPESKWRSAVRMRRVVGETEKYQVGCRVACTLKDSGAN